VDGRVAAASSQPRDVNSARLTNKENTTCAKQPWITDRSVPRRAFSHTRKPPSSPCTITAASAPRPSQRSQVRRSRYHRPAASAITQQPTT